MKNALVLTLAAIFLSGCACMHAKNRYANENLTNIPENWDEVLAGKKNVELHKFDFVYGAWAFYLELRESGKKDSFVSILAVTPSHCTYPWSGSNIQEVRMALHTSDFFSGTEKGKRDRLVNDNKERVKLVNNWIEQLANKNEKMTHDLRNFSALANNQYENVVWDVLEREKEKIARFKDKIGKIKSIELIDLGYFMDGGSIGFTFETDEGETFFVSRGNSMFDEGGVRKIRFSLLKNYKISEIIKEKSEFENQFILLFERSLPLKEEWKDEDLRELIKILKNRDQASETHQWKTFRHQKW